MEKHINDFKAAVTAALGLLTALWGWFGWLLIGWAAFMVLDYITGTLAAIKSGTWSSEVAREGRFHKIGSFLAVVVAVGLDLIIGLALNQAPEELLPFTYSFVISPVTVVWYMLTEAGSIIENAGELGAPIPTFLSKAIAALKDKVETGKEEE